MTRKRQHSGSSPCLLLAWPLLALLGLGTGCAGQPSDPCPDGNLVVVVNMAETVKGDSLQIDVLEGQVLLRQGTVPRPTASVRGKIEVNLGTSYEPGAPVRVSVSPISAGALQGRAEAAITLAPTCSRLELTVTNDKPEPDWSCIGMVDLVTQRTGEVATSQFRFVDMLGNPISGLTGTACADFDVTCTSPAWQDETQNGTFTRNLAAGFDGFIEVGGQGYYPARLDLTRCAGIMRARPVIVLLKPETLQELSTLVGDPLLLDERGGLTLATFDCRGYRVGGVSFAFSAPPVSESEPRLYVLANNWYPDKTLDATDDTGTAVIANLPTGMVHVRAIRKATGALLADFSTRVIAGAMTYVAVEPN